MNFSSIYAQENNISDYVNVIDEINQYYNSKIYIVDEDEFCDSEFIYSYKDYDSYVDRILSTSIDDFKKECIQLATVNSVYTTQVIHNTKSSYGNKTVYFNERNNAMTLKYKYSGNTYDTSYKPTSTVAKLSNVNYFVMSSYTGNFKNSNTRYTVVASGKLYGNLVITTKTFTVNFDL